MKLVFRHIFFLFCLFIISNNVFAYIITKFPAQTRCESSFPTAFVASSFSIAETTVGEFGINQSGRTIRLDVPAGWEYNTAGGTFSVTGLSANDITAISIGVNVAGTRLTVTLTTAATAIDLNTITVSCQIRAMVAGLPNFIKRNRGTFRIAKSTKKPTATQSLGDLSAEATMAYTSSTVTQPNTTSVFQGTGDNDIIRVEVVVTGTCNVFNLTQFNFNTTGSTNPGTDIIAARVYYSGLTSTFSPSGLFGSSSLPPSGTFTITGTQVLSTGTNYFWLVYDVSGTATVANVLDAQCTSITMDGGVGAQPPTATNPGGSRTIVTLTQFFSIATGNWNDNANWSNTDGGASCTCQPNGSGNVFIRENQTITLNAARTVHFVTVRNGAVLIDDGVNTLTVSNNFNTLLSGRFAATSAWTINGSMILFGTGASTTTRNLTVAGSLTIRSGTSLTENGAAGNDITLQGNLTLNGTLSSGTAGGTIIMNGASAQNISSGIAGTVSGTGVFTLSTSAKTIAALATLTISPTVSILGAITVTNNGTVTLSGNLTGSAAGSTWTNAANSTLNTAGTVFTTGTLNASASPNTVNYNSSVAQTVKIPNTTYDNLSISNAGTKTFATAGTISVANILTIQNAAIFDVGTNTLSGAGGLTMTGTSELKIAKTATILPELIGAYTLSGGTITLNQTGATTQTAYDEPIYYNLKLDGGAGSTFDISLVTDVENNFDVINQSNIPNTGNGALLVGGIFTHSTSGTNTLSGTAANDMVVTGSSFFSNGTFNANGRNFTTGDLTLTSGTLNGGIGTIEVTTGNWIRNGGTYTTSTGTVLFSGTTPQTIGGSTSTSFNNLTSTSNGARTLASGLTVGVFAIFTPGTNTYTVTGSTVDFNGTGAQTIPAFNYNNLTISAARTTNSVTLVSGGTIGIADIFSPTATFTSGAYIITTNTVNFNGGGAQTIPAFTFNLVTLSNAGIKTIAASVTVTVNKITLNSGPILQLNSTAGGRLRVI